MSESVIEIVPAPGTWVVRAGGAVLGESSNALELREKGLKPVIYFPRADISMPFIEPSDTRTRCPHKGDASYYGIVAKSGLIADAVWSYEDPLPQAEAIRGHLAFDKDRVAVEQL
ncbi:DUF427 domain-containing protein [Oceanomicrobium pacificus]|uniref:DUF427 domain-containing protein n=1 Tax=Oceanomicrobium pacificus TaxID=2692916 RepID=A0A6B0U3A1_9RHOB|nr:DUF427 domain-containing protein [Oceanomicrobium pacificus]MXU65441.1 DUF427 domain-containing protein [Oceanomicrobium pacificus]